MDAGSIRDIHHCLEMLIAFLSHKYQVLEGLSCETELQNPPKIREMEHT